jgi:membrane protein
MNESRMGNNQMIPGQKANLGDSISHAWGIFSNWVWRRHDHDAGFGVRLLRGVLRIIFIVSRESQDDRITLRASALTFTVVLSLVPMLALGTAVLKGLGAGDQMRQAAYSFIEQFDSQEPESGAAVDTTTRNETATQPLNSSKNQTTKEAQASESKPQGMTSHLRRAVDQIFDYVERTDFTTLGTIGIIGMVLAALSVLGSIEQSMNVIWQTTTGRALGRKIIDYMALMILLPISVNLALAAATFLQSPTLHAHIQNILPMLWLERLFFKALPVAVLVITFSLLYQFLPNIRVGYLPALAGGLFGGITWFLVQILYVKLQIGVARYNAIYGSFATLPLFFFWVYIAWVVFLLGAEVSFAVQTKSRYQWNTFPLTPVARLALAFDIMEAAINDYSTRKVTDRQSLALLLNQTEKTVITIVNDLVNGGLLRHVEDKQEGYVPAAPLNEIKPSEIMDIILGQDLPPIKGCDLTRYALEAARDSLDRYNLNCQEIDRPESEPVGEARCGTS